jgi:hypothetical protein
VKIEKEEEADEREERWAPALCLVVFLLLIFHLRRSHGIHRPMSSEGRSRDRPERWNCIAAGPKKFDKVHSSGPCEPHGNGSCDTRRRTNSHSNSLGRVVLVGQEECHAIIYKRRVMPIRKQNELLKSFTESA